MNPIAILALLSLLVSISSSAASADGSTAPLAAGEAAEKTCCEACVNAAAADDTEAEATDTLTDIAELAPLRDQFNADRGVPRGIALLSPVCPGCIQSAELIRTAMLEKYPEADLKLYVVWLPMVPGDARDKWNPEILNDARATHFWNGSKSIGKWFAEHAPACEPLGPVAWDVVYLFDPDAKWEGENVEAEFCPTPVYRYPEELAAHAERLFGNR